MADKNLVDRLKGMKPEPETQSSGYDKVVPTEKAKTPSDLRWPTYFMVPPFECNFNVDDPNNIWMQELSEEERKVDYDKAFAQWSELNQFIAANSLTYLIPNSGRHQDIIYCANMGLYVEPEDIIIMSNFTSEPRRGEEVEGKEMFEAMQYKCVDMPKNLHFEGEADLKFVRDNIFVGGYGIRSDYESYQWMEEKFNMKITKCHMTSERNYHFDCQFGPINTDCALVCTDIFDPKDIKAIEKVVDIYDIPEKEAEAMACNIVRVGSNILVCSSISELKESDDSYEIESSKIARLNKICIKNGLGLVVFNLSEFDKSGAALSCNVMHGNFCDFQKEIGEVM
jgi:N-dimethylarginine dimethylaminohydrolase